MEVNNRLKELVEKHLSQQCTKEELEEMLNYFHNREHDLLFKKLIEQELDKEVTDDPLLVKEIGNSVANKLFRETKASKSSRNRMYLAVSACIILLITVTVSYFQLNTSRENIESFSVAANILPAQNRALITLSSGEVVPLVEDSVGLVLRPNNLTYQNGKSIIDLVKSEEVLLQTPRASKYFVQLSDGTKVWLNADSELKFPSEFSKDERLVHVKGEAYFEIAKDALKPFRVRVNGMTVEAIGTAFNINTHLQDGVVKTILTEGRIRVSLGDQNLNINAGYAVLSDGKVLKSELSNLEEAQAWKDGYFYFDGKTLKQILAEISRWYDIEVEMSDKVGDETYRGGIKRSASIESICQVLNGVTGYKIEIKNKVLILK